MRVVRFRSFVMPLKTTAAEHGPSMPWVERNAGRCSTVCADHCGLLAHTGPTPPHRLAGLAALWIVLEVFVLKEVLFAGCKHERLAAINAGQHAVNHFHNAVSQRIWDRKPESAQTGLARVPSIRFTGSIPGPCERARLGRAYSSIVLLRFGRFCDDGHGWSYATSAA
jgi:hypothetical protein